MQVRNMSRCAMFAALLAVCAWIAVPIGDGVITLQTFGVFLALGLLGGKWGTASILVYLLLGAAGLPVFSGFRGGIGALTGVTGGYLTGFLFTGLCYWLITALAKGRLQILAAAAGLLVCYAFGSAWYYFGYAGGGLELILIKGVLPYVLPDILKLSLAFVLTKRLKNFV